MSIGRGFIQGSTGPRVKGDIWDVLVSGDGDGDYALISAACTACPIETVIGVKPGAYTEVADINMKAGQIVFALGGEGSDAVEVDMGAAYQWILAGQNLVHGIKCITINNTATPFFDINGTECTLEAIDIDASGYQTTTSLIDSASARTTLKRISILGITTQAISNAIRVNANYMVIKDIYIEDLYINANSNGISLSGSDGNVDGIELRTANVAHAGGSVGFYLTLIYNFKVDNITVDGPAGFGDTLAKGMWINYAYGSAIDNVSVNSAALGMDIVNLTSCNMSNIVLGYDSLGGLVDSGMKMAGAAGQNCSINTFSNILIAAQGGIAGSYGLYMQDSCIYNQFSSCYIGCTGVATSVALKIGQTDCYENKFSACNITTTVGQNFYIEGDRNVFVNCYFYYAAAVASNLTANASGNRFDDCHGIETADVVDGGTYNLFGGIYTVAATLPTANEDVIDGFFVGDLWLVSGPGTVYQCRSNSTGAAVWTAILGGAGGYNLVTTVVDVNPCVVNTQYDNLGAGAQVTLTLPSAVRGMALRFVVMAAQNLVIQAAAGDQIDIDGHSSSVAGTLTSNSLYSCCELIAVDTTHWVAIAAAGIWTEA